MTTPTTTAAPAAPQPERKPQQTPPPYVGRVVRDDGMTVDRWERPVPVAPRREVQSRAFTGNSIPTHSNVGAGVVYDLDAADEIEEVRPQRRRIRAGLEPEDGGYASLAQEPMRESVASGVKTRNAIRQSATWKIYAPWIGMVLFIGIAVYGYGEPKGWFGASQYPQTQPHITPLPAGVGTNHSRDLLIEWSRSATWKRLREAEQEAARKAVEADR